MGSVFYTAELTIPTESLHTLDPTAIVVRLIEDVPRTIVCFEDLAWRDFDAFVARAAVSGCIPIAENDARRRGPIWSFRIFRDGLATVGACERRRLWIHRRDEELPASVKTDFLRFLHNLEIPGGSIASYRLDGNDRVPT